MTSECCPHCGSGSKLHLVNAVYCAAYQSDELTTLRQEHERLKEENARLANYIRIHDENEHSLSRQVKIAVEALEEIWHTVCDVPQSPVCNLGLDIQKALSEIEALKGGSGER